MATQMHFEARRRQYMLDKAQEHRQRLEKENENDRPSTSQQSNRQRPVDEEAAKNMYKELKRQEKALRNNCLVMGPIEKYTDDETVRAKIIEMEKTDKGIGVDDFE